jgi:Ca2+-binding RTX toxin-like protein
MPVLFTPQGQWSPDATARNAYTDERISIAGKAGRLDYSGYGDGYLVTSGVADPDGVAVTWAYKGGATFGTGTTPTFTGFELPDQSSFVDLTGRSGNYQTNVYVQGGAGDDVVWAGDGKDDLYGLGGSDRLFGGGDTDAIAGGAGTDTLTGWSGNDDLYGNDGNSADGAQDAFVYLDDVPGGNGADSIWDFEVGIDKIDLRNLDIPDPTAFVAGSVTANTVNLGADGFITVQFATGSALSEADFIFA